MPKTKKKPIANLESAEPLLKMTLRLLYGNNIAMGPGKAELLERIVTTGSISAAGRAMDMSYRRAWLLVNEMNLCFKEPLVETSKGGQHGGGARLTPFGEKILAKYRIMENSAKQAAQAYLALFQDAMSEHPPQIPTDPGGKKSQADDIPLTGDELSDPYAEP